MKQNKSVGTNPLHGNGYLLTYPLLKEISHIEGRLDEEEAELLIQAAYDLLKNKAGDSSIVEVGRYCGKTTILLGKIVKLLGKTASRIYALDVPVDMTEPTGMSRQKPTTYTKFMYNISRAGLIDVVRPISGPSFQALDWKASIGLLLIDGLHYYDNLSREFFYIEKWIIAGGYVVFHDYSLTFAGVKTFVDELILSGYYGVVSYTQNMIILEKLLPVAKGDEIKRSQGTTVELKPESDTTFVKDCEYNLLPAVYAGAEAGLGNADWENHYCNSTDFPSRRYIVLIYLVLFLITAVVTSLFLNRLNQSLSIKDDLKRGQLLKTKNRPLGHPTKGNIPFGEFSRFCFRQRYPRFSSIVDAVFIESGKYSLSPYIVMAVIHRVSNFDRYARSSVAYGLMMINLKVWRDHFKIDKKRIFEVRYNISIGCKILRHYLDKSKGNLSRALFLYNNGFLYNNEKFVPEVMESVFFKFSPSISPEKN